MRQSYAQTAFWLLLIGATIGPLLDGFHTFSGTTWYPNPQFLRAVWWVPLLFAFAGVAIGMPRLFIEQQLEGRPTPVSRNAALWKMALFIIGYALSGFLPVAWWLKLIVLLAFFIASLFPTDTRGALVGAAGAAFGGWAVELVLTSNGLFFHKDTQLWGVAGWIPALYALAAVAVGSLARYLTSSPSR